MIPRDPEEELQKTPQPFIRPMEALGILIAAVFLAVVCALLVASL